MRPRVGGQLQVVTKSGSRDFHGSGYWYGRRSDWNANTWTNKRNTPETPKPKTSRNDSRLHVGGPIFLPRRSTPTSKKLFFFLSQEFQRRSNPPNERQTRVPTALERQGDFSQSVDSSGNPFPYIRDYQLAGCPAARPTRAAASRTAACSAGSRRTGSTSPASRLNIYPTPNFSGGSGLNFTSQDPDSRRAVKTCCAWTSRRPTTGGSPAAT